MAGRDAETRKQLEEAFRALDTNRSGFLERPEMEAVLKESGFTPAEAATLCQQVDTNRDGKISIEEFLNAFTL